MTTEAQARNKICPGPINGQRPKCVGPDCMGWIWLDQTDEHGNTQGYCGLTTHGPNPRHEHTHG